MKSFSIKHSCSVILLLLTISQDTFSQEGGVGIGSAKVHPSAILQLNTDTKGLMIPRLESPPDITPANETSAEGLLYYNTTNDNVYFWNGTEWKRMLRTDDSADVTTVTASGNISGKDISGTNISASGTLSGNGVVPLGGIIMWSGSRSAIPGNFEICDGGTRNGINIPDLRNRFIMSGNTSGEGSDIVYDKKARYSASISGCSPDPYIFTGNVELYGESCLSTSEPVNFGTLTGSDCFTSVEDWVVTHRDGCFVAIANCTTTNNPSYYLGNSSCRTTATAIDYYVLVFIIRVA